MFQCFQAEVHLLRLCNLQLHHLLQLHPKVLYFLFFIPSISMSDRQFHQISKTLFSVQAVFQSERIQFFLKSPVLPMLPCVSSEVLLSLGHLRKHGKLHPGLDYIVYVQHCLDFDCITVVFFLSINKLPHFQ